MPRPWISPKATFSQTGRLSNKARALEQHAELLHHPVARRAADVGDVFAIHQDGALVRA